MSVTNSPALTVISMASNVSSRLRPFTNVFVTPCTSNFGDSDGPKHSDCSNVHLLLPLFCELAHRCPHAWSVYPVWGTHPLRGRGNNNRAPTAQAKGPQPRIWRVAALNFSAKEKDVSRCYFPPLVLPRSGSKGQQPSKRSASQPLRRPWQRCVYVSIETSSGTLIHFY